MSEQNTIPAEMLDAAAKAIRDYQRRLEFADDFSDSSAAEAALRAAGMPDLVARIASAEQVIASRQSELDTARARIAELEAALRNRICEGCDKLMANVGLLHLCGCQDQRNLCSTCKAKCVCAGGE